MGKAEDERAATAGLPDGAMLDDIADIAARVLNCPIAVIRLVNNDRIRLTLRPETAALGGVAVTHDDPWVVDHAAVDPQTLANPLVAGALGLRFHAGVPLRSSAGHDLGTLAVMDRAPRTISDDQLAALKKLAGLAVRLLDMRLDMRMAVHAADRRITSAA